MEDPAIKMWRQACGVLMAPTTEDAWKVVLEHSASDTVWHSLKNCIGYQAEMWSKMLAAGTDDVIQPAAFKLAIVLRHTPPDVVLDMLSDLLKNHPQSQDLTSYILALLTDDEADVAHSETIGVSSSTSAAPLRDLQLFGDCELAVLAAPADVYARHSELVRAEYDQLSQKNYVELRVKVLDQFSKIPKLYHTPEFASLEPAARENIESELMAMRVVLGE